MKEKKKQKKGTRRGIRINWIDDNGKKEKERRKESTLSDNKKEIEKKDN